MRTYFGSEPVAKGVYFDREQWEFRSVKEQGTLPGTTADRFVRVPTLVMLVIGPLLGLLYLIFLPLVGFVMLASVVVRGLYVMLAHAGAAALRVLRPSWEPARSFFSNHRHHRDEDRRPDGWAEEVERELDREIEQQPKPPAERT